MDWPLPEWESEPSHLLLVKGRPQPQPRHRHWSKGKVSGTYDPAKDAKECFAAIVHEHAPTIPYDEPLRIDIAFYFDRPKSHYGSGRNADTLKTSAPSDHTKKPDKDNLAKFVMDALSGLYWRDDAVIVTGEVSKQYSTEPRTEIRIYRRT